MKSWRYVGFHEATLTDVQVTGPAELRISMLDVQIDNRPVTGVLVLNSVGAITRDDIPIDGLSMEYEDAEVLRIRRIPQGVQVLVEWNDFKVRHRETRSYVIECQAVSLEVQPESPDADPVTIQEPIRVREA